MKARIKGFRTTFCSPMFDKDTWHAILEHIPPERLRTVMPVCKTSWSQGKLFVSKYKLQRQTIKELFFEIDGKLRVEYGDACSPMGYSETYGVRSFGGMIDEKHFSVTHWDGGYRISVESRTYNPRSDMELSIYHNRARKDGVYYALPADVYTFVRDAIFGRFPWGE